MSTQAIPDLDLNYALISFDEKGKERTNDSEGGLFSQTILKRAKETNPSDIFLFTHGWKGDEPSAISQFNSWMGAMWRLQADRQAITAARQAKGETFKPMFIGLHWPSQPWGNEQIAPSPAAGQAFDTAGAVAAAAAPDVEAMFQDAVASFGDKPEVRISLRVIYDAYAANPGALVIPDDALAAYKDLADAVGFSANGGPEASPDVEGAPLDPQAAVNANRIAQAGANFSVLGQIKDGILGGLRQVSFWLMKQRGRTVGEAGMHSFLSDLMKAVPARIHLMGHSFGSVVVPSILGGPDCKGTLPRKVASTVLVQGAVSLWSWGDKVKDLNTPGYYRNILTQKAVSGPIVTTRSVHDSAVGLLYPAAVALVGQAAFAPAVSEAFLPLFGGVGSFGLQGTSIAQSSPMLDAGGVYNFQPGQIYNLEGSAFIPSHTGIDGPQVAHAIWQAAL